MDEYVTTEEAATRLRVSEETIRRWCRAGRLPAVQIGRQHRIPLQALLGRIEGRESAQPATQAEEDA